MLGSHYGICVNVKLNLAIIAKSEELCLFCHVDKKKVRKLVHV